MQSNLIIWNGLSKSTQAIVAASSLLKHSSLGDVYQVRAHTKMYPWRTIRSNPESYLDNTRTPYTDKHNINEFKSTKFKLKPWQKVICKNKDNRFNAYKWNDAYKSDPKEAKETAQGKFERLSQSLKDRGAARGRRHYEPPGDVEERVLDLCRSFLRKSNEIIETDVMLDHAIDLDREIKFRLISGCINIFRHDLPSSYLNDIHTVRDLVDYFSTPVQGVNPYEHLAKNNNLPPNLSIIAEPHRWDKENDSLFRGHNALPGTVCVVPGLRASKKYPTLNQDEFQWPDI